METILADLYGALYNLVGLYKKLLEIVRLEKEILISSDTKKIQEITFHKEAHLNSINQIEKERMKYTFAVAAQLKKPFDKLTLQSIVIEIQNSHPGVAQKLTNVQTTLTHLIKRISEQNKENAGFVEQTLLHVQNMKNNLLGEIIPNADVYTRQGKKVGAQNGTHLISKEF